MTTEEALFMRELRQLLKRHMVKLDYNPGGNSYSDNWIELTTFYGPNIYLSLETVAEELKQP